jgi:hypothetical protein
VPLVAHLALPARLPPGATFGPLSGSR